MKKRLLSGILSLLMVLAGVGGISAGAASEPAGLASLDLDSITAADIAIIKEASTYAYMSLDTATAELEEKILEARSEIIYHQSWTVDGQARLVHADGTIEELPEFYDLFPSDWDIPCDEVSATPLIDSMSVFGATASYDNRLVFLGVVNPVPYNNGVTNATPFVWYTALYDVASMQPFTLTGITKINFGFVNSSGQNIAYLMNRDVFSILFIDTTPGSVYGAKVSTNQNYTTRSAAIRINDGYGDIYLPDEPIPVW